MAENQVPCAFSLNVNQPTPFNQPHPRSSAPANTPVFERAGNAVRCLAHHGRRLPHGSPLQFGSFESWLLAHLLLRTRHSLALHSIPSLGSPLYRVQGKTRRMHGLQMAMGGGTNGLGRTPVLEIHARDTSLAPPATGTHLPFNVSNKHFWDLLREPYIFRTAIYKKPLPSYA